MTSYLISKTFTFAAAHRLNGLPDGHPCHRTHGHQYTVCARLAAPALTAPGWVTDYGDLAPFGQWLQATFDHRWLGAGILLDEDGTKTHPAVDFNPTAELLAGHLRDWLILNLHIPPGTVITAGVSETPKTWAWAR